MSAPAHTPVQSRERVSPVAAVASLQREYPIAQVIALLGLFAYGAATLEGFTSAFSIRSMLVLASLLGIAALGQTLCVLIGGLDVSVSAWILAGATTTVELLGGTGTRWPAWQVFLVLAAGSIVIGGLTGWICHRYLVPALVLTLAVNAMVTGAVLAWKRGFVTGVPPKWLSQISVGGRHDLRPRRPADRLHLGVPHRRGLRAAAANGRRRVGVYATGDNPRAAGLALVPTGAVWAGVFALSARSCDDGRRPARGFAAGGDASIGEPYLWNGLTAVLIGGTAFGGRGDYVRTVLGTLILIVLAQVMIGHGADYADQEILYGLLILLVVGSTGATGGRGPPGAAGFGPVRSARPDAPGRDRARRTGADRARGGAARAPARGAAPQARPDALVVVAGDHLNQWFLDNMPFASARRARARPRSRARCPVRDRGARRRRPPALLAASCSCTFARRRRLRLLGRVHADYAFTVPCCSCGRSATCRWCRCSRTCSRNAGCRRRAFPRVGTACATRSTRGTAASPSSSPATSRTTSAAAHARVPAAAAVRLGRP